mmetsp:Transcript_106083/g.300130  ORF Transcript_106083/g.300130 Transcript_106083/m.300130 type:complete len:249 (+) Transcript_106083:74-820(+)
MPVQVPHTGSGRGDRDDRREDLVLGLARQQVEDGVLAPALRMGQAPEGARLPVHHRGGPALRVADDPREEVVLEARRPVCVDRLAELRAPGAPVRKQLGPVLLGRLDLLLGGHALAPERVGHAPQRAVDQRHEAPGLGLRQLLLAPGNHKALHLEPLDMSHAVGAEAVAAALLAEGGGVGAAMRDRRRPLRAAGVLAIAGAGLGPRAQCVGTGCAPPLHRRRARDRLARARAGVTGVLAGAILAARRA